MKWARLEAVAGADKRLEPVAQELKPALATYTESGSTEHTARAPR